MFTAQFRNRHADLSLLQDSHDLGVAVSVVLHFNLLSYHAEKILLMNTIVFRGHYQISFGFEVYHIRLFNFQPNT